MTRRVDLKSFVRTCGVDRRFSGRAAAWSDAGHAVLDRGHQHPGPAAPIAAKQTRSEELAKNNSAISMQGIKAEHSGRGNLLQVSGFSRAQTLDIEGLPHLAAPNT